MLREVLSYVKGGFVVPRNDKSLRQPLFRFGGIHPFRFTTLYGGRCLSTGKFIYISLNQFGIERSSERRGSPFPVTLSRNQKTWLSRTSGSGFTDLHTSLTPTFFTCSTTCVSILVYSLLHL